MTNRYVIIGNSAAAVGAVESIRKNDNEGKLLIISNETHHVYSRPLISYYLGDKVTEEKMYYRPDNFYEENNVETILGKEVLNLSLEKKTISLEGELDIPYDKLLLAVGGKPFVPPIKGSETEGVFTFTKWDEAKKIKELLGNVERAVVIGGGLIGIKATEGLLAAGKKVNIVELANHVLSTIFDESASRIIEKNLHNKGVTVLTGNTVEEIYSQDDKVSAVRLRDGRKVDCQLVVVAIGVVPNTDLVRTTAIYTNRGIIVNDYMETNVENVYAAGDVAEAKTIIGGEPMVIPIWPNAYLQGKIAGLNMTGQKAGYKGSLVMNSIEIMGIPTISAGLTRAEESDVLINHDEDRNFYRKLVFSGNQLIGYIFVNSVDRAGIFTGLIKDRIDILSFKNKMLVEDFGLVDLPKEQRKEKILHPGGG